MTNKTKKLVWAIMGLLITVCACGSGEAPGTVVSDAEAVGGCGLGIAIVDFGDPEVQSGDQIDFQANKISPNLTYFWSTVPAEFSENFFGQADNKISFTVPDYSGTITIEMEVEGACTETAVPVTLDVTSLEEPEAEAETVLVETAVPTATPEPTLEQISEPTTVVTSVPSPVPDPTEIATVAPSPPRPPAPTNTPVPQYNAPIITELEFLPGGAIKVAWSWDGQLSPTQNFAVRFWSEADPRPEARFSITWTKDFSYQFGVNSIDFPEGTYYINVAVMEGPSDGIHYALAESSNEPVFVRSIPPTATPFVGGP